MDPDREILLPCAALADRRLGVLANVVLMFLVSQWSEPDPEGTRPPTDAARMVALVGGMARGRRTPRRIRTALVRLVETGYVVEEAGRYRPAWIPVPGQVPTWPTEEGGGR